MQISKILISIIVICLIVSACNPVLKHTSDLTSAITLPGSTVHSPEKINGTDLKPVEYPQQKENLSGADKLTTFPGVFENMFLTLEQIISVLGNNFELEENIAQGYDTYIFNDYDLKIEFDRLRHRPSAIYLSDTPYYFNSGSYEKEDLNGDGASEYIIVCEDYNYSGKVLLIDGQTGEKHEEEIGYLGNKSNIKIMTGLCEHEETVIIIETHGGKRADIFKYDNNKLVRILPENYSEIARETLVTVEADKAVVVNKNEDILHICPLPDRISRASKTSHARHNLTVNLFPEINGNSLILKARTNVQVKLFDVYDYIAGTEGIFCDVAGLTRNYRYMGNGKWEEISLDATVKYEEYQAKVLTSKELGVGAFSLNQNIKTLDRSLYRLFEEFTTEEINSVVLVNHNGLVIGVVGGDITYLSLESGNHSTKTGLKLQDPKDRVLELYGLPDRGFVTDPVWTYYIYREETAGDKISVFIDALNLEFYGDKVCRIWMTSYIAAS